VRILYLTEFLSAVGGGGEVMFRDFAVEMANRGHKVDLVCHQSEDSCELDNLLTVHRIPPPIGLKHGCFPSLAQQLSYISKLVIKGSQIIDKNKIDLIHANTISPAFAGAVLGRLYGIPVINTIHHVHSLRKDQYAAAQDGRARFSIRLLSLPKFLCEKIMVRLPAIGIHTVSESSKDDLIRFGVKDSSKIKIVSNAVDFRRLHAANDVQYGGFALFIGRLVEYKNLDVIVTAFRKVVDEIPEARFAIVGDGPAAQKWKELVSSNGLSANVEFLGYVTEEKKDELLRNCSMLVFPSLIEGFGLVILESFARKKPVIVSDIRPLNEIVDDGVDGFIVPATSPSDWAETILLVFKNKSSCEAMGTRGRNKVEARFNIIHAAEDLESFYEKLIGKQHRRVEEVRATI
jgi:glycosyltransferase involved in cell wall biosynthesis